MARKIFLICLAILFSVHGAAAAKDEGLPEEDRIKIAVEITNHSRYKELPTAQNLENFLSSKLVEKNLLNIVNMNVIGEPEKTSDNNPENNPESGLILDEDVPANNPSPAENIGEILIFEAVEVPRPGTTAKDFDANVYSELGAAYVMRCEVLGLGVTKVEDKTIGTIMKVVGSGLSFGGNGSSNRDKTLRKVGTAIGLGGFLEMKRTALNTVVSMQFINAQTGEILWQQNFIGQAIKHSSPREGYANAWEQAYIESVEDSAKKIAKRVNKYVDRVIIKGKPDKSFTGKNFSFNGLGIAAPF